MDPRWQKVEALFEAAAEKAGEERAAYLAGACGGDEELRHEVEELLAADEEAGDGFLESAVDGVADVVERLMASAGTTNVDRPGKAPAGFLPSLPEGFLLCGRFRIVRFLAAGGMGEVYEAEDRELGGERVAIKTLRPDVADDEVAMKRFRREVQLARRVTHPAVCRSYDIFRHQRHPGEDARGAGPYASGVTFLSMELLTGETLMERIHRGGPLSTEEALPIVRQIAGALDTAHQAGIIHRDLKSSNVVLEKRGRETRAVVTDFGLARPGGATSGGGGSGLTATGLMLGTPAYMAPEQVREAGLTSAADIYSLGVLMFEMVTGRFPFEGESHLEIATKRLEEPAPSPRTFVAELDSRWEEAILRCLAFQSYDRFPSGAAVVDALESNDSTATSVRVVEIRAALFAERRRYSRRPLLLAVATLLLAVALAVFVFFVVPGGGP